MEAHEALDSYQDVHLFLVIPLGIILYLFVDLGRSYHRMGAWKRRGAEIDAKLRDLERTHNVDIDPKLKRFSKLSEKEAKELFELMTVWEKQYVALNEEFEAWGEEMDNA